MHKNLFGIAAIITACGFLLQSINPAHAILPVGMSHGDFPYQVFTSGPDGYVLNGSEVTVLTVPADKNFVITGLGFNGNGGCRVFFGATEVIGNRLESFFSAGDGLPLSGNLRWPVPAGESLKVKSTNECVYVIHGYYAHAPS